MSSRSACARVSVHVHGRIPCCQSPGIFLEKCCLVNKPRAPSTSTPVCALEAADIKPPQSVTSTPGAVTASPYPGHQVQLSQDRRTQGRAGRTPTQGLPRHSLSQAWRAVLTGLLRPPRQLSCPLFPRNPRCSTQSFETTNSSASLPHVRQWLWTKLWKGTQAEGSRGHFDEKTWTVIPSCAV